MPINQELFKQQMNLLGDRIGRELAGPTQVEYWRQLTQELTDEQFLAAMTLLIRTWNGAFRQWPSPQQIIETIRPVVAPTLSAFEAFEKVLEATSDPRVADRRGAVQALGASAYRAFLAAGGLREFANVLEADVTWLRKRFAEAFEDSCANAEAEQLAQLAKGDADVRIQQLINATAAAKQMPAASKRISA